MKTTTHLILALSLALLCGNTMAADGQPQSVATPTGASPVAGIASIENRLGGLRELPADQKSGVIKGLARDIRVLPASAQQLELALDLSWVCTEGDPGLEALQGVTNTLEQVLRHDPPITSTNDWAKPIPALARLVHFEGVKTALKTPEFLAEMKRLQELDQKLEAADFTLKDLDGKAWTLKALKGQVVLVNFWATWCPPCCAELPDLKALAARHAGDLVVLGITSEEAAEVKPFVSKEGIRYPVLLDPGEKVSKEFGVVGIPRTLIYDRAGKLVAQAADMRTRKQLDGLLAKAGLPSLMIGDPAPPLQTGKWLQGEPVRGFEKGKSYLIEFWATWCGPCVAAIPHVNELHTKYAPKGLVVIGQNVWEDEPSAVPPFLAKMAGRMTYRVALDDKRAMTNGAMATTWLRASQENGIPCSFLVDGTGRLAWIGHPDRLQEPVVEDLLTGRLDPVKTGAAHARQRRMWGALEGFFEAAVTNDWSRAKVQLGVAEQAAGDDSADDLLLPRLLVLSRTGQEAGARRLVEDLLARDKPDAELLNGIAWNALTMPGCSALDAELAEAMARRAVAASQEKKHHILDTLARALFVRGQKSEAIAMQEKALALVPTEEVEMRKYYQEVIDSYRAGRLPADP